MRYAFDPNAGELRDVYADAGKREGLSHLMAGAIQTCERSP